MSAALVWILGSGGLLGSHMPPALAGHLPLIQFWQPTPIRFSWTEPTRFAEQLSRAVSEFGAAVRRHGITWAVLWCAGKGTISSLADDLEPEWLAWNRLLNLLGHHLAAAADGAPGYIFLASSAGGVYGGNRSDLLTEKTAPRPGSAYGAHKLRMEEALKNWGDRFSNVSCLVGRISTLYGTGQDMRKPQGIIAHLSRCLIHREQVNIYVPLDTRRDYLFVDDCAHQIAACLSRLMIDRPQTLTKIFASERSTSIAQIIGIFFRITKHRSLIISRQSSAGQSTSLTFRSDVWRDLLDVRKTDLAVGIHLLHTHQLVLFQRGQLPRSR